MAGKFLLLFLVSNIFVLNNFVTALGEDRNFTEFLEQFERNISLAQTYVFPKDNTDLLKLNSTDEQEIGTYDFIVIGAGAAGGVIANRLSEISDWKVLLLEAGGEDNDFTKILGIASIALHSDFTWGYNSTPQANACKGMVDSQCFLGLGKVIGGSTTVNAAIYSRGHPEDFDRWVDVYGNPGWSYQEVLPYFKKSEYAHLEPRDVDYHGDNGAYEISYPSETPLLETAVSSGFQEIGLEYGDYNGQFPNRVGKVQFALKGNERVNTGRAFLGESFRSRPNIELSLNSFVTEIIFEGNMTKGVKFIKNGQTYVAYVDKEVVLSAGAANSPQILMLSGVGPKEHLEELSIPVKKDLPVGKNLQDHFMFLGLWFRTHEVFYNLTTEERLRNYVNHTRPLTAGFNVEMAGFTNFDLGNQINRSLVELIFCVPGLSSENAQFSFGLTDEYTSSLKVDSTTDIWVPVVLLHPKSRGSVTLKSSDPKDKPNIDPNYLGEEEDVETIYQGIQYIIQLNNTQTFQEFGIELVSIDYPKCDSFEKQSKDWWYCAIRHFSSSIYHPASTNRMGSNMTDSVVNARLQAHGLEKLRIADASVLPELNSGHTTAPVLMIGEKVSDYIKEDYGVL